MTKMFITDPYTLYTDSRGRVTGVAQMFEDRYNVKGTTKLTEANMSLISEVKELREENKELRIMNNYLRQEIKLARAR